MFNSKFFQIKVTSGKCKKALILKVYNNLVSLKQPVAGVKDTYYTLASIMLILLRRCGGSFLL